MNKRQRLRCLFKVIKYDELAHHPVLELGRVADIVYLKHVPPSPSVVATPTPPRVSLAVLS